MKMLLLTGLATQKGHTERRCAPVRNHNGRTATGRIVLGLAAWTLPLLCLAISYESATAAEMLKGFQPSSFRSAYGTVSQVQFTSGLFELPSKVLTYHPEGARRLFRFAEPVWVIGFKSEIYDSQGEPPGENYLCHTFVSDMIMRAGQDEGQYKAVYSDAFTREVRLPDGFGMRIAPNENLYWTPIFNNRRDHPTRVGMNSEIIVIREKDLKRPLRRLYTTMRTVDLSHLFFVPPGRHERHSTVRFPFDGRIHFIGTHLHPHGESMELFNISRQERVWKGIRITDAAGRMVGMEVYSSTEGYPVRAGESYRMTSVYDNPRTHVIDAMAGLFIYYSLE